MISGNDKSDTGTKSSTAIKSSVDVDKQKLAAKPSTTGVITELTDKEKEPRIRKLRQKYFKKPSRPPQPSHPPQLSLLLAWTNE